MEWILGCDWSMHMGMGFIESLFYFCCKQRKDISAKQRKDLARLAYSGTFLGLLWSHKYCFKTHEENKLAHFTESHVHNTCATCTMGINSGVE